MHYAWFIFLACCAISGITVGLIHNSSGLFQPYIAQDLGIPRARVAMMQTIQSLAGVVGLLLASRYMERFSLRRVMSLCVVVVGTCYMLNATFHSIYLYYITFACIGLCQPFFYGLAVPTMLTNWFRQRLGMVMGLASGMTGIGGALFNPVVARSLERYGWRTTYFATGVFLMATLLPLTLLVIRLKPTGGQRAYGYISDEGIDLSAPAEGIPAKTARRMPAYYLLLATMGFLALPGGFMQQVSPHVLTLGHSVTTGASVMSGLMLGIAGGKIIIGGLLDRFRAPVVLIGFGLVGMAGWLGLNRFVEPFALIFCGFLAGSAHGISQVGVPVGVRRIFGVREYSRIFAGISAAMSLVGAVMPTLGSAMYDLTGSYATPLTIAALAYTAAVPCMLLALKLGRRATQVAGSP